MSDVNPAKEPRLRRLPIARNRRPRNPEDQRHFLFRQSTEVPEFHDSGESLVDCRELGERLIQIQECAVGRFNREHRLMEQDPPTRLLPFLRPMGSRVIDKDSPHHLRRNTKKLRAVLPVCAVLRRQAHVGLIDEGRRLKRMTAALTTEMRSRKATQLGIYLRHEFVARFEISPSPCAEKNAHATALLCATHNPPPESLPRLF